MTYRGPNSSLITPQPSADIFDANCHPDLDALIELRLGSKIRVTETDSQTNMSLGKILLGLFVGVAALSYFMYKFVMTLGY